MEIATIYYKAKDGRLFTDPLKCEEYEKTIGILHGSVGELIANLEKLDPDTYIFGTVYIKHKDGTKTTYCRCTICVDDKLDSFVNVKDLTEEQRFIISTVKELIHALKEEDKDNMQQHTIVFSKDINLKKVGIMSSYNPDVWDN
jgi:hypothetical protein